MNNITIPDGYQLTDVGVIPIDWDVKMLGEIAIIGSGGTPNRKNPTYWNGQIPWITTSQINFNIITSSDEFITSLGLNNSSAKMYKKNTLLMAMYGQGKTRGKVGILGINATINQACASISLNNNISNKYIFLNLSYRYEEIRGLSNTGNQENLNGKLIKSIKIPLPPLKEQKRIAKVLSTVDELITALDELINEKRHIKQGTMQELLTGKTRLKGFTDEWEVKKLGEVCDSIIDGTHYTPKYVDNGIPFYSVENVTENNFKNTKFISLDEHKSLIKRCNPTKGDILLTRIGSLGETKLIDWDINASIYVSLALLKVNDIININYLYNYTKSHKFNQDIIKRSLVNATPQKINMGDIGNVPISLPPSIEEQKAIANILSKMDEEIEVLEKKRDKYKAIKQGLMSELLTGKKRLLEDV